MRPDRKYHLSLERHTSLKRGARQRKTVERNLVTVAGALDRMKKQHIVKELTGFKRNRVFAYTPYVELLNEGTEPIR